MSRVFLSLRNFLNLLQKFREGNKTAFETAGINRWLKKLFIQKHKRSNKHEII